MLDPEQEAWDIAKRLNSLSGFEAYLRKYPQGRFSSSAEIAISGLSNRSLAVSNDHGDSSLNSNSHAPTVSSNIFTHFVGIFGFGPIAKWETLTSEIIKGSWYKGETDNPTTEEKGWIAMTRNLAQQGHFSAEFYLGEIYEKGRGVAKDDREAVSWYRKAATQGYRHDAIYNSGDDRAQFKLGLMYLNGRGVPKDDEEAINWFRKAADQGNLAAQVNLGWMYTNGRGVPKDDQKAVSLFQKAADLGYPLAQLNLGWMYENGRGVPKDDQKAVSWYRKAAQKGNSDAKSNLDRMYKSGLVK